MLSFFVSKGRKSSLPITIGKLSIVKNNNNYSQTSFLYLTFQYLQSSFLNITNHHCMKKRYLLLLLISTFYVQGFAQQIIDKTITWDNETREYSIYIPAGYQPGMSLPMVFDLHGLGSNIFQQRLYSAFIAVANTANVFVVHPQGLERTQGGTTATHWNAHFGTGVDDLGFLNIIIDYMYTDYGIDLSRVYSTGMSNGGFMSYMLSCQLNDRIAAIASVTGTMTFTQIDSCMPTRPTPIMQIHGTADSTVPYVGSPFLYPDIDSTVNWWVNYNNCSQVITTPLPDIDMTDNSTASLDVHSQCDDNVEVHFYKIQDGGHSWPGAFPVAGLGNTNQDFKASEVIWQFFNQYQHPNPRAGTLVSTQDVISEEWVNIFPNPVDDILNIVVEEATVEQVSIYDAMGRVVKNWHQPNPSVLSVSVADLTKGIYLVQIRTNQGVITQKVVKQ